MINDRHAGDNINGRWTGVDAGKQVTAQKKGRRVGNCLLLSLGAQERGQKTLFVECYFISFNITRGLELKS